MYVSLRHWPIFVTGLLLGAAGTMSLGLHRPTQAELAAARPAITPAAAASAPAATVAQGGPDAGSAERADGQMRSAAEAFRAQEALAAASTPFGVALAQPPKTRVRRAVKETDAQAIAIAIAPITASQPSAPVARLRGATSVMGAAPEGGETRPPSE